MNLLSLGAGQGKDVAVLKYICSQFVMVDVKLTEDA